MRNPIIKDTFREIKKTKSRFFSIFAIVAIGVAFFAGIFASAPTMRFNADQYFDDYNLMDYRILSNFGITDNDIEELSKLKEIAGVHPAYSLDVLVNDGQSQSVMRVHSLNPSHIKEEDNNYINQLIVLEGRLPEKAGEIVVEKAQMLENAFEIGHTIQFVSGTEEELSESLNSDSYEVVGIVQTPYYLSFQKGSSDIGSGSLGFYGYVLEENFDMDVYTEVFLTVKGAKPINSYEDEYFDYLEPLTQKLETLGIQRSEIRREEILDEAMSKYNDGLQEYEDGLAEFNEEISKAEKEIEDAEKDIFEGEIRLQSNRDLADLRFEMAQQEIDNGEKELESLKETAIKLEEEYKKENAETIRRKDELEQELNDAELELIEKQKQFDEAQKVYTTVQQLAQELVYLHEQQDAIEAEIRDLNADLSEVNLDIIVLENEISQLKLDLLLAQSEEEKNEIQASIDQKNVELETLNQKKTDLSNQINEKEDELDSIETQIDEFNNQNEGLNDNLTTARNNLNEAQRELDATNAEVESLKESIEALDEILAAGRKMIDLLNETIEDSEKQLEEGKKQLAEGKVTAAQEFLKAEKEIADGKKELEDAKIEFLEEKTKAELELEDAREELVKAKNDIDEIEEGKWYVLDRNSHYSYVDYQGATERMDAIAVIFPVFFFLVAALVCLTTMTRMVDEQRNQIGTMKALGYPTGSIAFKYVFYAAFASVSGSFVGLAVGLLAFPAIIYTAWNMMYILPIVKFTTHYFLMFISTLISVCVTTCAAFFACYSELTATPALLMRPKAPKLGKKILLERIDVLWKRFSFTSKVTARNLFRYKKRFFMTVIGISGCTALLVAGFGLKDSINAIVDVQFGQVFKYIGVATVKPSCTQEKIDEIAEGLIKTEEIHDVMDVHSSSSTVYFDGKTMDVTLMVVDDTEEFKRFVDMHERISKEEVNLSSSGVVITEHMANQLNIQIDDEIVLSNEDGIEKTLKVTGIVENYVNHFVYMSSACYKNSYDLRAKNNALLITLNPELEQDDSITAQYITEYEDVESLTFYTSIRDNFKSMIASLDYIVIVLIISAGALAFVVLYNLTNVNISERLREIATLKVLGFHDHEVNTYVYKENIILTLIGSLAGIGLGKLLHLAIMVMVELDNVMFGRVIHLKSYLYSIVITLVFAVIVNQVMKKRLKNIPMVESLKSVE